HLQPRSSPTSGFWRLHLEPLACAPRTASPQKSCVSAGFTSEPTATTRIIGG
ncbi:hypothetical protein FRC10_006292, partial [Ceratobasidium sp. 414]